jgi:hypothetical protein
VIADAAHPKGPPLLSFSPDEAKYWQNRYNAGNVSVGHPTVGPLPDGTNPNSGQPSGTQVNPVKVENNLQLRALPFGTWIQGPDGTVTQKKALAPQGQKTSQADTGDQGQQVADVTQPQQPASLQDTGLADAIAQRRAVEAQPPPQLAALTPSSTPGSFDLGQLPPTGGLPQDTDLADAIARARAGDQLSAAA